MSHPDLYEIRKSYPEFLTIYTLDIISSNYMDEFIDSKRYKLTTRSGKVITTYGTTLNRLVRQNHENREIFEMMSNTMSNLRPPDESLVPILSEGWLVK